MCIFPVYKSQESENPRTPCRLARPGVSGKKREPRVPFFALPALFTLRLRVQGTCADLTPHGQGGTGSPQSWRDKAPRYQRSTPHSKDCVWLCLEHKKDKTKPPLRGRTTALPKLHQSSLVWPLESASSNPPPPSSARRPKPLCASVSSAIKTTHQE